MQLPLGSLSGPASTESRLIHSTTPSPQRPPPALAVLTLIRIDVSPASDPAPGVMTQWVSRFGEADWKDESTEGDWGGQLHQGDVPTAVSTLVARVGKELGPRSVVLKLADGGGGCVGEDGAQHHSVDVQWLVPGARNQGGLETVPRFHGQELRTTLI